MHDSQHVMLQVLEYIERAEYINQVRNGEVPAVQAATGTGQKARPAGGGSGDKDGVNTCTLHPAHACIRGFA